MGTSWQDFAAKVRIWSGENDAHNDAKMMLELANAPDRLRHKKIKKIRQLICAVAGSNKSWEVVAGQALGTIERSASGAENMLVDFMGEKAVKAIIFRTF